LGEIAFDSVSSAWEVFAAPKKSLKPDDKLPIASPILRIMPGAPASNQFDAMGSVTVY
jgi:hypothetical protein